MKEVRGVVLPSPTVFREDGSIDEPLMRELTDWFVACGVQAFLSWVPMARERRCRRRSVKESPKSLLNK